MDDLIHMLGFVEEDVPGETRQERARELVEFMKRRSKMTDLIRTVKYLRPDGAGEYAGVWPF